MANLTIERTATGWHIEGVAAYTSGTFTADLLRCDCDRLVCTHPRCNKRGHCHGDLGGYHGEHVEKFLGRVAATYAGKTDIPEVPA